MKKLYLKLLDFIDLPFQKASENSFNYFFTKLLSTSIIILLLTGLGSCTKGDPPQYTVQYMVRNSLNFDSYVSYFSKGRIVKFENIKEFEAKITSIGIDKGSIIGNFELSNSDSVRIEFANGRSKTDYVQDYFGSSTKSIYRDEYYITEKNCENNPYCSQYIYIIDEQDYAEAK
jgi:hypothetical protein